MAVNHQTMADAWPLPAPRQPHLCGHLEQSNVDAVGGRMIGPGGRAAPPVVGHGIARHVARVAASARLAYGRAAWLAIGAFVAVELAIIFLARNGPFEDEGIYITAGLRTLQGHGLSDNYVTWLFGSLLWPVLAGVGYSAFGLIGARLLALLCVALAVVGTVRATRNIYGERAAFWAALALAASGPALALGHFAVYDVPALACLGLSFWAVTELARRDNRIWLLIAAVMFSLGGLAKYNILLDGLPLAGLIVTLRGKKALVDLPIFAYISLAILLSFFLPFREQLGELIPRRVRNNPTFGATQDMLLFTVAYLTVVPGLLAIGGWLASRGRRGTASVLLGALFIWPAFHIATRNGVSFNKHVVFGYLFAYPLVGLAFARLARGRAGHAIAAILIGGLALLGSVQMGQADHAWPDVRPTARYLVGHVHPGQRLLINDAWPYTMYLYAQHRITSPWDVYDAYRIAHDHTSPALCAFDWYVDEGTRTPWSRSVPAQIAACGTFVKVLSGASVVTNVGRTLRYVTYTVYTEVWRNVRPAAPARRAEVG
jgi:hypothetical protein